MVNSTMFYPHPTNSSNPGEFFFTYTHTVSGGLWGPLILLTVFTISYLALSSFEIEESFAAASFTTMVTAALLAPFEVIHQTVFILTVLMTVIATLLAGRDRGV